MYIISWYDQNTNTEFEPKFWVCEDVKRAKTPWVWCGLDYWWGNTCCNDSSSVPTWTRNRTANLAPLLTLFGTNVMLPIVTFWFGICEAETFRNWMCLHPWNSCKYSNEHGSATCWVYRRPNHWWIQVCDNWVEQLAQPTGFDIRQCPHQSSYSNARVSRSLYVPNNVFWAGRNHLFASGTRTSKRCSYYWPTPPGKFTRRTSDSNILWTVCHSLCRESWLVESWNLPRRPGAWRASIQRQLDIGLGRPHLVWLSPWATLYVWRTYLLRNTFDWGDTHQ